MECSSVSCPFCRGDLGSSNVTCSKCGTVHHFDCWLQHGRCSVYGCGGINLVQRIPGYKRSSTIAIVSLGASVSSYLPFVFYLIPSLHLNGELGGILYVSLGSFAAILALVACHLRMRKPNQYSGERWYTLSIAIGFYVAAVILVGYIILRALVSIAGTVYRRSFRIPLVTTCSVVK